MSLSDQQFHRIQSVKCHADGDQMTLECNGRANERYGGSTGIPFVQAYGMAYHPPAGSHGINQAIGGNNDGAMCMMLEHHEFRPKDLTTEGEWKHYDKWGHFMHAKQDLWHTKVGTAEIKCIDSGGVVHINPSSSLREAEIEADTQRRLAESRKTRFDLLARLDELTARVAMLEQTLAAYRQTG